VRKEAYGLFELNDKADKILKNNPQQTIWDDKESEREFNLEFDIFKQKVKDKMESDKDATWKFIRMELFRHCPEAEKDPNEEEEIIKVNAYLNESKQIPNFSYRLM